jgi:hypothetical protein
MDYLALKLSDQLMAERRVEARRHNLAKQAREPRSRTIPLPRLTGLLRLVVRPARAEGTR